MMMQNLHNHRTQAAPQTTQEPYRVNALEVSLPPVSIRLVSHHHGISDAEMFVSSSAQSNVTLARSPRRPSLIVEQADPASDASSVILIHRPVSSCISF